MVTWELAAVAWAVIGYLHLELVLFTGWPSDYDGTEHDFWLCVIAGLFLVMFWPILTCGLLTGIWQARRRR